MLIWFLPVLLLNVSNHKDKEYRELVRSGMELGFQEKYEAAFTTFDYAISLKPDYPVAYLYKAGLLDLWMLDYLDDSREGEFFGLLQKAIKYSEPLIKSSVPETIALGYFYKGSALMYAALRYGRRKRYLSAANAGLEALKTLLKVPKYNPYLYDVYLPLGIYYYAVNKLPKSLKFLKIFLPPAPSKDSALKLLEISTKRSIYVKTLAKDAYAWVLAYDRQTDKAIKIAQDLIKKYPMSKTFYWTLAYAYKRAGRWEEALRVHKVILFLTLLKQRNYPINIAYALYYVALSEYVVGKKYHAVYYLELADMFLKEAPDSEYKDYLKKRVQRLRRILKRYKQSMRKEEYEKLQKELDIYGGD